MENGIQKNITYLANHLTNVESVLLHLMEKDIISNDEREKVLSKDTSLGKHMTLLILLQKRDWNIVRCLFLEILKKTHNGHCANKIEATSPEVSPVTVVTWNYETNAILGYGSFGVVISARDKLDNQNYALKIIPHPKVASGENAKLLRESRNQATLHHPNVVKYLSSDTFSLSTEKIKEILHWESSGAKKVEELIQFKLTKYFKEAETRGNLISGLLIKTEICGENLRQWLNHHVENETIPDRKFSEEISKGIIHALNYIHSKCIIHRDVRPENIYFSKPNFTLPVKIGDFGLSNQIENYEIQTMTTEVGSYLYQAPETTEEHKESHAKYSHAVDLYSCGFILCEIADPAPTKRLRIKFNKIINKRDTGTKIRNQFPLLNGVILKLTEEEPGDRFCRDKNGKPIPIQFPKTLSQEEETAYVPADGENLTFFADASSHTYNESSELLPQESNSLQQKELRQTEIRKELFPGNVEAEIGIYGESKWRKDLTKLVELNNISEIVKILSISPTYQKYFLEVDGDKMNLKFDTALKKMALSQCSLNLNTCNKISTEELELGSAIGSYRRRDVSFFRNGKELEQVTMNEIIDIRKIKKLTLHCPNKENMSIDLRDESVSLEYLNLYNAKVLNWQEAMWTVKKFELKGIPFAENTKMKVEEMEMWRPPLVDLSCLPHTLEKLTLKCPEKVFCTGGRIEMPNLKFLELSYTSNQIISHFSSVNLTHIYLERTKGNLKVDLIPKSVISVKIDSSNVTIPLIVGSILQLDKLILEGFYVEQVERYLTHFQPKELVVNFDPHCRESPIELLQKDIPRIAIGNVAYDSILSKYVDTKSDYYLFERKKGRGITKWEFGELLKL